MLDSAAAPTASTATPASPASAASGRIVLDIKLAITILNRCLLVVERSAWQLRSAANQTHASYKWLEGESKSIWQSTRLLPARLARLSRCGWMLTRLLSGYRFWPTRSAFISSAQQDAALAKLHRKSARLFVDTSLAQGGAFLKIGQLLSTRSDLLPATWITELSRLQDQALPEAPAAIHAAVEAALGCPLSGAFSYFDTTPLACASIGQVHRATLEDGRDVAVKVQRPDIAALIDTDMLLLGLFLGNLDALLPGMDIATLFAEIKRSLHEELDYEREAAAMRRVARHLSKIDGVSCPAVIDALSSRTLLVTEFVHGRKLTDVLDDYQQTGASDKSAELMTRLLDAWLLQVLQLGFFHADPHPGNLLVTDTNQLVLLDFGACQSLTDSQRQHYLRVLQAAIVRDEASIACALNALGFRTQSGRPDTLIAFTHALLTQLCERISAAPGSTPWPAEDELIAQGQALLAHLQSDPVAKLPSDFIMLARVFLSLGGLFVHYRPAVDLPALILKHLTWPQALQAQQSMR